MATINEKHPKRGSFMSIYKPSSGNRIKTESKPSLVDKNYINVSRSWLFRKQRGRKEAEDQFASGREPAAAARNNEEERGGQGREEGMVVVEARKSVSHVETNLASVASFLQVKVLVSDMPGFMQVHAFRCCRRTYDSLEKFSAKHMAYNMKKEFDKVYGPAWHCIVGSNFGSFVTHSTGCFLYFSMEKLYILLFKTKVQKAAD
ncbi:uncharacterized protein LOC107403987 [Ziziphus jujuba]|uniref:Uncharacterized protein LOC107403987 n=1 Tax=Ziziphus jujuba TaxID=326968 RepID=A0A6P3YVV0_ZIZJJ|nr:uncharacterized protein LOC107403987 [Ziziphus jujuba]